MTSRVVEVSGLVTAITYPGYGQRPDVRVRLDVSGNVLDAIFQSRTSLNAIDIGERVSVRGALIEVDGVPCMFNPELSIKDVDDE